MHKTPVDMLAKKPARKLTHGRATDRATPCKLSKSLIFDFLITNASKTTPIASGKATREVHVPKSLSVGISHW